MKRRPTSLPELIRFARDHSPYYRELYRGLPDSILSLEQLPIVKLDEFWAANDIHDNRLLTGAMEDGLILKSGGTTGKPKFSVFARDEWNDFTQTFANKLALNGLRDGDRVANLFYVGQLYGSFIFTHKVLENCPTRLLLLPIAGGTPLPETVKLIKEYGATVIAGLPTTILSLFDEVAQQGGGTKVRMVLFAGEPMHADQRERARQVFPGVEIRSIGYASTDAGPLGYADLSCEPNEFRNYDDDAVYEILDEETGQPIRQAGQEGRAVLTHLKRSLMPVIRYPVGDRAVWVDPEGTPNRKFLLLGRSEESARIGAITLHIEEMLAILERFSSRMGVFQFQLVVVHRDAKDGLIIRIGCRIADSERLTCDRAIIEAVHASRPLYRQWAEEGLIHPLQIDWREPSALETNPRTGKLKRVIDLRSVAT